MRRVRALAARLRALFLRDRLDPLIMTAALTIAAAVTLAAVWQPSRRAVASDPSALLRER